MLQFVAQEMHFIATFYWLKIANLHSKVACSKRANNTQN